MAHFFTFTPKKKAATDIDFIHLIESTGMKILVATEKPFAKEAVDGIRRIVEDAGYELALLENIPTRPNCWPPWPMSMRSLSAATR